MKALSIRQPWAWCIVNGHKNVENRDWSTRYRGPVLIHAAKTFGPEEREACDWIRQTFGIDLPDKFDLGGIVGVANLVDCVTTLDSPWFFGPNGFILDDAHPLLFLPVRGQLGFFNVDVPEGYLESKRCGFELFVQGGLFKQCRLEAGHQQQHSAEA